MNSITLLGYITGFLVVVSLVPQTIKAWKTKLTRDISLWRYIIYVVGLILWIIYAILTKNSPVAFTNSVGLVLAVTILCLKIRYK